MKTEKLIRSLPAEALTFLIIYFIFSKLSGVPVRIANRYRCDSKQLIVLLEMNKVFVLPPGVDKIGAIAALYNAAWPRGASFVDYDPNPITRTEMDELLDYNNGSFNYLKGRPMKTGLPNNNEIWTEDYDAANGKGAAAFAIKEFIKTGDVNSPGIRRRHNNKTLQNARFAKKCKEKIETPLFPQACDKTPGFIDMSIPFSPFNAYNKRYEQRWDEAVNEILRKSKKGPEVQL